MSFKAGALIPAHITGTGMYVPPEVYTNKDLEAMMDTSDEWIRQRSGIRERHFAKPGVGASDLAYEASVKALEMAGLRPQDIDIIIFASLTPDYYFPGAGCFLQDKLGLVTTPALDVRNQCSGFLYGLSVARSFVATGQYRRVLLACAETHSRALNLSTQGRDVAVLFGDGAGAIVVEAGDDPERGIQCIRLHAQGAHRDALKMEGLNMRQWPPITHESLEQGQQWPKMDGKFVFKHAVTRMPEVVAEVLTETGLEPRDVDLFLFHQANLRINEAVMKQMSQPLEKSYNNIDKYGNCSAASIPMCLDESVRQGRLKRGDVLCTASFGAGFTWGGALIRW